MGGGFLVLFVLVAVLRSPPIDRAPSEDASVDTETVRSFWELYNAAAEARRGDDFAAAAAGYRQALALEPGHQDSLFFLAVSLESAGNYTEATAVLRELTSLYPEHSRGWSQLGTLLASRAPGASPDLDQADAAFRRSEAINPEHTGPFLNRGRVALERGKLGEAAELFRIAAKSGAPEGVFLAGLTAYLQGDDTRASNAFLQVLEMSEREEAIAGRGASGEGDVEGELTALDRARIRARAFLFWTAQRMGGYLESVPERFRDDPVSSEAALTLVRSVDVEGRGAFIELGDDAGTELVLATPGGILLRGEAVTVRQAWDVVVLDIDRDGWEDLYAIGSGYTGVGTNTLLRNDRGRFVDVTEAWGLSGERATARAIPADLNGDGETDLLEVGNASTEWASVRVFLQGDGRFELADSALPYEANAVDAAVADIDRDGKLDVFLLGWKAPGRLFRNHSETFEDWTASAGLARVGGDGLSAVFLDFDRDGDDDLLVTALAPLELSLLRSPSGPTPRLFRNDGGGHFTEHTSEAGLDRSFGVVQAVATDLDADGFVDLIFALGGLEATHVEPSVVLRNRDGRDFVDWAYLPSASEPRRVSGIASAGLDVFVSGVGVFRRSLP